MQKKTLKKVWIYTILSLLCLIIILPNGIVNLATADETAIPLLDNIDQVEADATLSELESESADETATETESETVTEPETVLDTIEDPATVIDSETSAIEELEDRAVENPDSVDTPSVPETEQTLPVPTPVTPEPAAAIKTVVEKKVKETLPEIGEVTFSPRDAKVGDMVTVTAKMIDGNAIEETVEEVVARLWAPNQNAWDINSEKNIRLRYDADDQQWVGFFIVQETWKPGYWRAEIEARYTWEVYTDYQGAQDHKDEDHTYKNIQFAFNVLNTGDSTPPQAIELIASPNPVKAGQAVSFAATVKDVNNQSDIVYALLQLDFGAKGFEAIRYYEQSANIPLTYDAVSGKWIGTYKVPVNVPDGTEVYYHIGVADRAGNITDQYYYEEGHYFVVKNPNGDISAPVLEDVYSPNYEEIFFVTEELGSVDIPIDASIVDEKSGVKSVTANIYYSGESLSAAASQEVWYGTVKTHSAELTYDSATKRYVGSVDLTVADRAGSYEVYITAEDNNGNIGTYYATNFVLENPDTDWFAPEILDFDVIGDPVKFGDVMKINAKVTDENPGAYSSGIHSVMANIYYDTLDEWEEVELTLNPNTGRYEADYSIKQNDVFVAVYVYATDKAGNISKSNTEFVQIYNLDDYLPPYIDFVKYPPATMYQGETAHFETRLVDEGSGIHSATITLINVLATLEGFEEVVSQTLPLTYNSAKGIWETDWLIPNDSPTGLFLVNLTVFDNVGNKQDILNDGEFGNIPQTLVILPKPSPTAPTPDGGKPTPVNNPTPPVATETASKTAQTTTATVFGLPNTATNNFNLLFAGLAMIVIGIIGGSRLVFKRKVKK